ncbi:MAG: hypothetical protein ACYC27_04370 [Armatimonadota bacterium]
MKRLNAGYIVDPNYRNELNSEGRNYWWAYIEEVIDRIGLTAEPVTASDIEDRLMNLSVIFISGTASKLMTVEAPVLTNWVKAGGILIGSNIGTIDELFGNQYSEKIVQQNEFSISGKFHLRESGFTAGVHSPFYPDEPLLAASDIRLVNPISSETIAVIDDKAVITAKKIGYGWAFYFGFDIAQTFWVIQQGCPVDRDIDNDGYLRTGDGVLIGNSEPKIAYTDELAQIIQNMIGVQPYPLIDQLPPDNGMVPDMMLYYGGDDEGDSDIQVESAEFMHSRGLPYHLNCMPIYGKFGVDKDQISRLHELGTETSLHYDFINGFEHPSGFTEDDVKIQAQLYLEHFGETPVCVNTHFGRWVGWYEAAEWMMKAGAKSGNMQIHIPLTEMNPVNTIGFAFGTSFPHHYWMGHERNNEKLDMLSLPVTAYEVGYIGEDQVDAEMIETTVNLACHYRSIMNIFYHPIYVARYPACREAIDLLKSMLAKFGIRAIHSTPDNVTQWWNDRSNSRICDIVLSDDKLSFKTSTSSPSGIMVKVPADRIDVDDVHLPHRVIDSSGQRCLLVIVPQGENEISLKLTQQ